MASTAQVRFTNRRDRAVVQALLKMVEPRLAKTGAHLVKETRALFRPQPTTRTSSNGEPLGYTVGLDPSKEGEAPKRLDGGLHRSISYRIKRSNLQRILLYGVPKTSEAAPYAARLEFGFVGTDARGRNINQGPRPYLRRAVSEQRDNIKNILGGKL